jgi:hypothetical protein
MHANIPNEQWKRPKPVQDARTSPSYNLPSTTKGRLCAAHRHDGMVDVKTRRAGLVRE